MKTFLVAILALMLVGCSAHHHPAQAQTPHNPTFGHEAKYIDVADKEEGQILRKAVFCTTLKRVTEFAEEQGYKQVAHSETIKENSEEVISVVTIWLTPNHEVLIAETFVNGGTCVLHEGIHFSP
jgi:hypothetical protein